MGHGFTAHSLRSFEAQRSQSISTYSFSLRGRKGINTNPNGYIFIFFFCQRHGSFHLPEADLKHKIDRSSR